MPTYPFPAKTNRDTHLIQLPPIPLAKGTAITVYDEDEYYGYCSVGKDDDAKFGPIHFGDYTATAGPAAKAAKAAKVAKAAKKPAKGGN